MTEARQTIAVVGLGAIGGILAGCLRAADRHDVVACVRAPLARIVVERPEDRVDLPLAALTEPAAAEPVDWVLLCTKAQQSASTATLLTYPPEAGTSMYFDRLAGKALEIEAITGFIVAAGDRLGVPVPLNRAMLALLRAVSDAANPVPTAI